MSIENPEVITRNLYEKVSGEIPKIKTLVDALAAIDRGTVSNNIDVYAEVRQFEKKIMGFYNGYRQIIDKGDLQYKNRPKDLINKASHRGFAILNDINLIKAQLKGSVKAYETQVTELKKKNFTSEQIEKIAPNTTEEDAAKADSRIKALNDDRERILAFISDGPEFNQNLIKGISIVLDGAEVLV
ncbi:MAG: hypothetical protein GQ532_16410 [Methylomarinum sp.]|nr:hypothetical protein [Methylomarinum sp.]